MTEHSSREYFDPEAFPKLAALESRNWWFCSRNKIILWILKRKIGNFQSFLEIGCGTGFVLESIQRAYADATLFGSEFFEEGLKYARERVPTATFSRIDATEMTDLESFDAVGAFDVLEHIEDDSKVLVNLAKALKPGGALVITVPQHPWLWSPVDQYACHVRRYSRVELVGKVQSAGLRVQYVSSFVSLLLPLMWFSRFRAQNKPRDPMSEFLISTWMNAILEKIMNVELVLLKFGFCFPIGGSLLLVGRKP